MNRQDALDAAKRLVAGRRDAQYGPPTINHARIAELLNAQFHDRLTVPFAASDVAVIMILTKLARIQHDPTHEDSWVDIAGYAACGTETSTSTATTWGEAGWC